MSGKSPSALAGALLGLLLAAAASTAAARAQPLPRLHVLSFTMTSDVANPRVEQPFHIIVDVRVAERIATLDQVVLPMFGPLEITGDERQVAASGAGSEYRETIGVVAHASGTIAIPPAHLDAIDARDGKAKRFLSTPDLTLHVAGPGASIVPATTSRAFAFARTVFELALGCAVVILLAVLVIALRRPPAQRAELVPETEPVPARPLIDVPRADPYDDALAALRAEPTRGTALAARDRIRSTIGANEYDTLEDVLRRPGASDPRVRAVLRALERAAFTHDADVAPACAAAVEALERLRR